MKNYEKRIQSIISFLMDSKWKKETSKDGKIIRISNHERELSDPVYVFFNTSYSDEREYIGQIQQAEDTILQFYGTPYRELINRNEALKNFSYRDSLYGSDKLITKVPDRYVSFDSVDLSVASSTFKYLQSIIKEAASTESKNDGAASNTHARNGRDFMHSCRFGHTFRGSFGFQVECPIIDRNEQFDLFQTIEPIGRRVSERFIKGLNYLIESITRDDIQPMLSNQDGFTFDMCNSTINFLEETSMTDVTMSVEFDRKIPTKVKTASRSVSLNQNMLPILKEASAKLNNEPEEEELVIVGRIVALKSNAIPLEINDTAKREITVAWDDNGRRRQISAELSQIDYLQAIHAYEVGDYVKILGTLKSRKSKITNLKSFSVV